MVTLEQIRQAIKEENQSGAILKEVTHIKDHLEKLNGKVAKHEQDIFEMKTRNEVHDNQAENDLKSRANTCPIKEGLDGRIKIIETRDAISIGRKQFIIGVITFIVMVLGAISTVLTINDRNATENMETIIKEVIDERLKSEVLKNNIR